MPSSLGKIEPNLKSELPGPWGNSPQYIATWFGPHTDLKVIFDSINGENDQSIAMLNSFCVTLGLPHRFNKEDSKGDIASFMSYLSKKYYRDDFSLRVSEILLSKIDEDEGKHLRDFLERINLGIDDPLDVSFREEKNENFNLERELGKVVWAIVKTFGLVGGLYQIYLFFRILGML